MTLDTADLFTATTPANMGAPAPRKCARHFWRTADGWAACARCGAVRDETARRRNTNNRKRGNGDELVVANLLGGRKVGQLGLPWDVEVEGYARIQCKKLKHWPSLAAVVGWLDAIPAGRELRMVALADTPGAGRKVRRLAVVDLDEFAAWHGRTDR